MIPLIIYAIKATDMLLNRHYWKIISIIAMLIVLVIAMRLPELITALKTK